MRNIDEVAWKAPGGLLEEGFRRPRVVMVNEAHDRMLRCIRTQEVGSGLLPVAHRLGVRALAMEAFGYPGLDYPRDRGYLDNLRWPSFVGEAEAIRWSVLGDGAAGRAGPVEISGDPTSMAYARWRERE